MKRGRRGGVALLSGERPTDGCIIPRRGFTLHLLELPAHPWEWKNNLWVNGGSGFFLRGRSSLPTPKKRNNTSPKTQYTRTLQGVSNELPHTTYRLPLGTPWRLLVSNPFYLLKSCPFPMTTPSSEVKPTSRAFSDQRLVGHQSSSQHVRGRPDLSM